MVYRQKLLLALLESFGGRLANTDLEKLLFLFCKESGTDYYDFFPYRFGPFSFISYHDKRKLVEIGALRNSDCFELRPNMKYIPLLAPADRHALRLFASRFGGVKGRRLLRWTYLAYPEYSSRSEIATTVLSPEELSTVTSSWNYDVNPILFSIGYEGISIDKYLYRLISNNVRVLIDVRKNPLSRKHGFSKKSLEKYIRSTGIDYCHVGELGVPSAMRRDLNDAEDYSSLFEYYRVHILANQSQALNQIRDSVTQHRRVALTCFEADYQMCHRHVITDFLEADDSFGVPVIHI